MPVINTSREGIASYGSSTTTVTVNNITAEFYIQSYEEVRHFWPYLIDKDLISDLLAELKPTDIFYDIGAHTGIFSCLTGQTITEGQVVAFEPVQININRLRENLRLNNTSAEINPVALSDESKLLEMDVDSNKPGTIGHFKKNIAEESESINTVIGDDYIQKNNIPLPNVVKIDVEGVECKVLRGLENHLTECRLIYAEARDDFLQKYGDSEKELVGMLQDMGFEVEYVDSNNLKATRDI